MGVALVTKRVVNACQRSAILVVRFIVGGVAALMAKLGTRRSASVYRGEWTYCTRNKAFVTGAAKTDQVGTSNFFQESENKFSSISNFCARLIHTPL